jgi:beta-glucosidase
VVLFNGHPLDLTAVQDKAAAILEAWFPGTEGGNAVADVLYGKVNPGGKLPVSFPRGVGTVPYYYNHEPTGRPCDATFKWNSRYRDLPTCQPLYPFGYGLSYTSFDVSNLTLSRSSVGRNGNLTVSMDVKTRAPAPVTMPCRCTSTTPSRASPSRSAGCAASSA